MRQVSVKTLLTSVASLHGGQPLEDVTAPVQLQYAEHLTTALRYAWNWAEWPELQRTRQRTPSSGLVAWEESGQPDIGTVYGVTLDDPNTTKNPRPADWRYDANGQGIRIFNLTSGDVYVRHSRKVPELTSTAWASDTTYAAGDVAYDATTGQCYESLQGTNLNNAVTDADWWRMIEIPHVFRVALPRGADALRTGTAGQKQTETLLRRHMDELLAMEMEQFRSRAGQHQNFNVSNLS